MRDFIAEQINNISNIEEKILLKELLNTVFLELYETSESRYEMLEQRIKDEIPLLNCQYSIHMTVMEPARADASHAYLSPMVEADMTHESPSAKDLQDSLSDTGSCRVLTVFYEADYLDCQKLLQDTNRLFRGVIQTKNGQIPARFMIRKASRYARCIERLYKMFASNNLVWQTVNAPYINKFLDVYLVETEDGRPIEGDMPISFKVDFEEFSGQIRKNLIPVWNVKKHVVKADDFPVPVEDKLNYEYRFDLTKLGPSNGYLVDDEGMYVSSSKRVGNELRVVSPMERNLKWNLFVISKKQDAKTDQYHYPLMTNRVVDAFAGRLLNFCGTVVKTRAEIERVLGAYGLQSYIQYRSLEILDGVQPGESYEMNFFIRDEIRDPVSKKTLTLRFEPVKQSYFLNRDVMSFLVSQIQLMYPEYICAGKLV